MESTITLILVIHIVGGGLSMLSGFTNIVLKKGTLLHKKVGDVYFIATLATSLTAIMLAFNINNPILHALGIITLYMLVSGVKYLSLRKKVQNRRLALMDWLPSILLFLYSIYLIVDAITYTNQTQVNRFFIIGLVAVSLFMVWQDVSIFKGIVKRKYFHQTMHLQRMISSFIVLIISFLMVNALFLPLWANILLPICTLLPLIFIWTKKYSNVILTNRMLH